MKKILLLFLMFPLFIGCKSKEEKALNLINDNMFKTLYDYDSYQPVETTIDSAFTNIYMDSLAIKYAIRISALRKYSEKTLDEVKTYLERAQIYKGSYYSQDTYQEYIDKAIRAKDQSVEYINRWALYEDSIKTISNNLAPEFIGWRAKHKFRCKSKGGNALLANYLYIFDQDLKQIIYSEDMEDELEIKIKKIIDNSIK